MKGQTIIAGMIGIALAGMLLLMSFLHTSAAQWIASAGLLVFIFTIMLSFSRIWNEFPGSGFLVDAIAIFLLAASIAGTYYLPLSTALLSISMHFLTLKCYMIMKSKKGMKKRNAIIHFNTHAPFTIAIGLASIAGFAYPSAITNFIQAAILVISSGIHAKLMMRNHNFLK